MTEKPMPACGGAERNVPAGIDRPEGAARNPLRPWACARGAIATLLVAIAVAGAPPTVAGADELDPAATSAEGGRLDVFQSRSDGMIYHAWWHGAYQPWENLGGPVKGGPEARSLFAGHLEVFARGTNDVMYHRWFDPSTRAWSGWDPLGGPVASDAGAAAMRRGSGISLGDQMHLFVRGMGNNMLHRFWVCCEPSWRPWEDLGGQWKGAPAAVSLRPGHVEVFARGLDDAIWHNVFVGGTWSGWRSLGGPPVRADSDPGAAAGSRPSGQFTAVDDISLFVKGTDAAIWETRWTRAGGWTPWETLEGQAMGAPDATYDTYDRVNVFARSGINGFIYFRTRSGGYYDNWKQWPDSTR